MPAFVSTSLAATTGQAARPNAMSAPTGVAFDALLAELMAARGGIEQRLFAEESYRALTQLNARELGGTPVQAIGAEQLRRHLIEALTNPGDYAALQRLDAAIAALTGVAVGPAAEAEQIAAAEASPITAVRQTVKASASAPIMPSLQPANAGPIAASPMREPASAAVAPVEAVARAFAHAFRMPVPVSPGIEPASNPATAALATTEAAIFASVARLRGEPVLSMPAPAVAAPAVPTRVERSPLPVAVMVPMPPPPELPRAAAIADVEIRHAAPAIQALTTETIATGTIDRLERIRGIDSGLAARLRMLGVTRYAQIAQWRASDIQAMRLSLGADVMIQRHNWIEQAAMLAAGRMTQHARAVDAGNANAGRRLTAEPPSPRYGTPAFFRIGLPGGTSSAMSPIIGAVPPSMQRAPEPTALRPVASPPRPEFAAQAAVQTATPPARKLPAPPPPASPHALMTAAAAANSKPAGLDSVRRETAPAAIARTPAKAADRMARAKPAADDLPADWAAGDWAEVTIVPRTTPIPALPAMARPATIASPSSAASTRNAANGLANSALARASASAQAGNSLPASRSGSASAATTPPPRPELKQELRAAPIAPARIIHEDLFDDEAVVEIRRHDLPQHNPPAGGHAEPAGLGRLLRAFTPVDRTKPS